MFLPEQLANCCEVISIADIKEYYRISQASDQPRKPKFKRIEIELPAEEPNIGFCKSCVLPIGNTFLLVGGLHTSKKGGNFKTQLQNFVYEMRVLYDSEKQPEKVVITRLPQNIFNELMVSPSFSPAIHHKVRVHNSEKSEKWRVVDEGGSVFEIVAVK